MSAFNNRFFAADMGIMKKIKAFLLLHVLVLNICMPAGMEAADDFSPARIGVNSNVAGADIYIDGDRTASTPLSESIAVSPGFHRFKLTAEGYTTWREELFVNPGESVELEAIILPLGREEAETPSMSGFDGSSITIISNTEGATLYIDRKSVGLTPFDAPVTVAPGFHKLRLTKEGYSTWRQDVTITSEENFSLNALIAPLDTPSSEKAYRERKPFHESWLFWAVVIAAGAAVIFRSSADESGGGSFKGTW